jgi:hypothetical protein
MAEEETPDPCLGGNRDEAEAAAQLARALI